LLIHAVVTETSSLSAAEAIVVVAFAILAFCVMGGAGVSARGLFFVLVEPSAPSR